MPLDGSTAGRLEPSGSSGRVTRAGPRGGARSGPDPRR
jgi:hypothetical protein